jgi:tetratricopeptide (TPR) repeat protein
LAKYKEGENKNLGFWFILAKFYYERGFASNQMGLIYDALSDLRKAFYYAEKAGSVSDELLSELGKIEWKCGSITRAVELLERAAGYGASNNVLTLIVFA